MNKMTSTTSDKDSINQQDLYLNEQDDFLLNLLSINEFSKEDFDWFNNLHLNYTPGLSTEDNLVTSTLANEPDIGQQQTIETNQQNSDCWLTTTTTNQAITSCENSSSSNRCKKLDKPLKFSKEKTIKNSNKNHLKKSIKSTIASATTSVNENQQQQNHKKVLIKRSRKRTKPIAINTQLNEHQSQTTTLNTEKSSPDSVESGETSEKKSELEPLNKKLAIDKSNHSCSNSSKNNKNVDLQIEQFSLLDLHSSEDDSELFTRTYNPKIIEYNQKDIAKRIKYSRYSSSETETRLKVDDNQQQKNAQHDSSSKVKIIQTPKTSQKDIDKLIQLLKESSSLSPPSSFSSTINTNNNTNSNVIKTATTASDTNNSSNESNDLITNKNSKRKKLVQNRPIKPTRDEFSTLNDFKSLDINSDYDYEITNFINENSQMSTTSTTSSNSVAISREERQKSWNTIKQNASYSEILSELGPILSERMSFWDLVKLKLKFGKNKLKTTYGVIDDYTLLYSNMSKLLEHFVKQHSTSTQSSNINHNRSDNSSRSRSSSRSYRKTSK